MPLDYDIEPDRQLVTITGGYLDALEWETVLGRVLADSRYRPGFGFLRDLRTMAAPADAMTMVKVMEVVRAFWPRLQPSGAAMLTPRDFDPAALSAHAIADSHGLPIQMFTSYDAAMAWLQARRAERRPG